MRLPSPLVRGTLIERYKRFLADVRLDDGRTITAVCPNTGSMLGLTAPGSVVWLSESDSPTRKFNTGHPNRLVAEALAAGRIRQLGGYAGVRREVNYGVNSRIDLLLECARKGLCYVEVKNVHLSRRPGLAEFPDCETGRGVKHLREMAEMVRAGHRAVLMFLVQRNDARRMGLAGDIAPTFLAGFQAAIEAGVEPLALRCRMSREEIVVDRAIPIVN
jgi:sugar fermentation stimulation protein A